VSVKSVEEVQTETPEEGDLAREMKKAAMIMKRLERAVDDNDWVEVDMWTEEIKEGIGSRCVALYKTEHKWISSEFVGLHKKFVSAINRLILCSKEHDSAHLKLEFNRLIKSCDDCHEVFDEDEK
jgi:hypothetical protein